MHARVPGSQIIWYDSMTTSGYVQWQNNITPQNEIFFEAADGIFLNYWWNVRNSHERDRFEGKKKVKFMNSSLGNIPTFCHAGSALSG